MTLELLQEPEQDVTKKSKLLTKQHFEFGVFVDDGSKATIDLPKLIKTRLIIEASSGGGKSWLMRKLIEIFCGYVQQIVIDPEGEFGSLREKFPFILATAERDDDGNLIGEVEADPNTADALAHTILKTRASIVIDISELTLDEKKRYVKNFVEALVQSPRELWHPVLVWIDEAHDYAPESSHGKSESLEAIKDLASKGRKRGQAVILATQRLSKLSKDAAAELKNYLIGNTNLDLDQDRAGDILGFASKKQKQELREIEPGIFWASGSVFNSGLRQVKVGQVITHHPEAAESGSQYVPPPTPEEIKPLLATLHEIPVVKKRNLEEKRDLLAKVREQQTVIQSLTMKLRNATTNQDTISPEKVKQIRERAFAEGQKSIQQQVAKQLRDLESALNSMKKSLERISSEAARAAGIQVPKVEPVRLPTIAPTVTIARPAPKPLPEQPTLDSSVIQPLRAGAMKMLKAAAQFYPNDIMLNQIATLAGFSVGGGTFGTYRSEIRRNGWWVESGDRIHLTEEGLKAAGPVDSLPADPQQLIDMWAGKFRDGAAKMLRVIASKYPNSMTKEELATETGFAVDGGTFNTYLSELRRNQLVVVEGNSIRASPSLFLEET